MKKKIFTICVLLPLLFASHKAEAQVTIGLNKEPVAGALLELNNSTATSNGISTLGLGLPRMLLTNREQLTPVFTLNGAGTDYVEMDKVDADDEHVGLVVYNIGNFDVCDYSTLLAGVYVWNGEKWANLEGKEPDYEVGPTVEILTYKEEQYYTRQFGSAGRWMVENLRARKYDEQRTDGKNIDHAISKLLYVRNKIGAEAPYEDFIITNPLDQLDETLYMWNAATAGKGGTSGLEGPAAVSEFGQPTQDKVQGICPAGWHLPSDYEYTLLENEIITNTSKYSKVADIGVANVLGFTGNEVGTGVTNAPADWRGRAFQFGMVMRAACEVYLRYNASTADLGDNVRGESLRRRYGGFDAQIAGFCLTSATPNHSANHWTSSASAFAGKKGGTNDEKSHAIPRRIETRYSEKGIDRGFRDRRHMFSVRCVKDGSNGLYL